MKASRRSATKAAIERLNRVRPSVLTCVYCGARYPEGTPPHGAAILTDHIRICEKHPMRRLEEEKKLLRLALIGLVGAEEKEELEAMQTAIRLRPRSLGSTVSLNAIHALLQTAEGGC